MNFVENFNFYGVDAKEIPCIKGDGAPTESTIGAVGCLYMDTRTGKLYKCVAVNVDGFAWENVVGVDIVQGTGNREDAVMSQKAATSKINEIDGELKKALNYTEGRNLFNNQYNETEEVDGLTITYTKGYAGGYTIGTDGKIIAGSHNVTYAISIKGGQHLYFLATTAQNRYTAGTVWFYDSNGVPISSANATKNGVTTPENAAYMRVYMASGWQINTYPTLTTNETEGEPYEPYFEPYYAMHDIPLRDSITNQLEGVEAIKAINHEYNVHLVKSLRKELADLREYVHNTNTPTILDTGKCGENLTWTLYSDGLLKITGTGRSYDFIKGVMIGDNEEEVNQYVEEHPDQYYYGFTEGKNYHEYTASDGTYIGYVTPWYRYRPEVFGDSDGNGYCSKTEYDRFNPNGWHYNRIEIDKGITYIGDWMFYRTLGVTELTIPEGVTEIGIWCIRYCTDIIVLSLPDSLTTIGEYGISRHETSLKAIKFGNSVENIGKNGLASMLVLDSLILPASLTSAGDSLLEGNKSLKYLNTGGLTNLPKNMCVNCSSLTEVYIGEGVTSIGVTAFFGCTALKMIHIPEAVETIGGSAFLKSGLTAVYLDSQTVANVMNYGTFSNVKTVYIKEGITPKAAAFISRYDKCETFNGYTRYVRNYEV